MLSGTAWALFLAAFSFCAAGTALNSPAVRAADKPFVRDKVILLVIDGLPVEQFTAPEWSNLRTLAAGGLIGLMNSRTDATASAAVSAAAHLTLGAGARRSAGPWSGFAFGVEERWNGVVAGELYAAATGRPPPDAGVVVLGPLPSDASGSGRRSQPETLGQWVANRGGRTAVVGNGDTAAPSAPGPGLVPDPLALPGPALLPRRHGALLAMNGEGVVPAGTVGVETLVADDTWPFRWRTDYDAMWRRFADVYEGADVIVVEFGDFVRLDAAAPWLTPAGRVQLERQAMARIDEWIGRLLPWPPAAGAAVGLLSPSPPAPELQAGLWLTPLLWTRLGADTGGPQLATGATTRRTGIVANVDVKDHVLGAWAGRPPAELPFRAAAAGGLGRDLPPTVAKPPDPWAAVALLYERAVATHRLRPPVVRAFVQSAIVLFVLWTAWFAATARREGAGLFRRTVGLGRFLMLALCAAPLAMLLLSLFPQAGEGAKGRTLWIVLTTLLAAAASGVGGPAGTRRATDPFVALSLLTALVVTVDAWCGSPLMKASVLGYDPIVGARYYGIGNEYMGVLVGTTLIGATGALDRRAPGPRSPIEGGTDRGDGGDRLSLFGAFAVFAAVVFTLASPAVGANVGGAVTAIVGCGITAALLSGRQLTGRVAAGTGGAVLALLGAAAAFDVARGGDRMSHLGRVVLLALQGEGDSVLAIFARKLAMNIKLLSWTIWAQVFVVSLAVSALGLYRSSAAVARLEARHPRLLHGVRGATVAALTALVVNDSGVVAAATMMIPVTAVLMYIVLRQRLDDDKIVD